MGQFTQTQPTSPAGGDRFRIIGQKGGRRISCPPGTQLESSGKLGTGQPYVWCYRRPAAAPQPVAPQITYEAPRTEITVPTAITTAISPQISPTLAQQQASPGAAVTAQPVSAPGPTTGSIPTGISEQQLRDILSAQAAATEAERTAAERQRAAEIEELRRQMAARERATQEIDLARRAAEAIGIDQERFAREQAEATAARAAEAVPPPPSMTYVPSGGGTLPAMPPEPMAAPDTTMEMEARDVTITQDGEPVPWALIAIAAAGIGAVVLVGAKGAKRKRGKK